jgi:hypothetical protein
MPHEAMIAQGMFMERQQELAFSTTTSLKATYGQSTVILFTINWQKYGEHGIKAATKSFSHPNLSAIQIFLPFKSFCHSNLSAIQIFLPPKSSCHQKIWQKYSWAEIWRE